MFEGSNVCDCIHTFDLVPELLFTSKFVLNGFFFLLNLHPNNPGRLLVSVPE